MHLFHGRSLQSDGMIRVVVCTTLLAVGLVVSSSVANASPRSIGLPGSNSANSQQILPYALVRPEAVIAPAISRDVDGWPRLPAGFRGGVERYDLRLTGGLDQMPRGTLPSMPGDDNWSSVFGAFALDDQVYALTVHGSDLYVGGAFATAGGNPASRIAKWNGASWSALGSGMDNYVIALAADGGGNLYAGGWFTTAGGNPTNYIAKWDGDNWTSLAAGMSLAPGFDISADVRALALDGNGDLYAGGWFTTAGGNPANFVAKWDGNSWSALGSGMNSVVYALLLDGLGNLYAGGDFTSAGGNPANHIAMWNGSMWSGLGNGVGGGPYPSAYALALDGSGGLYAGGSFTTAGGKSANRVAKWNGSAWSALGTGINDDVYALATWGGVLFAGGMFTTAGGNTANYVAEWNGSSWSPLGSGVNRDSYPRVTRLDVDARGNLYVGGRFTTAGGKPSSNVALWSWPFADYLPFVRR